MCIVRRHLLAVYLLLDAPARDEPVDDDVAGLPYPVRPANRLVTCLSACSHHCHEGHLPDMQLQRVALYWVSMSHTAELTSSRCRSRIRGPAEQYSIQSGANLSTAWLSVDGFHDGSTTITRSAAVSVSPRPPTWLVSKNTGMLAIAWNFLTSSYNTQRFMQESECPGFTQRVSRVESRVMTLEPYAHSLQSAPAGKIQASNSSRDQAIGPHQTGPSRQGSHSASSRADDGSVNPQEGPAMLRDGGLQDVKHHAALAEYQRAVAARDKLLQQRQHKDGLA